MDRPPSISRFEQLWWGSLAFWSIGTWLGWERTTNALNADRRTAEVAGLALWGNVALTLFVTLLFWWLAARRGSIVGKWLVIAAAAWSAVRALILVMGLLGQRAFHPLSQTSLFLSAALTIASAVVLFRPDALMWFGEVGGTDEKGDEREEAA